MIDHKKRGLPLIFAMLILITLLLSGCLEADVTSDVAGGTDVSTAPIDKKEYTVSFTVDGEISLRIKASEGETVWMPRKPEKENYIFTGWCRDAEGENEFDFSTPIYEDTTLYASFTLDAAGLMNKITTGIIRGVVRVDAVSYNTIFGIRYDKYPVSGSGVIFEKEDGTCFVLTNCHVAMKLAERERVEYTVTDYLGNSYRAELHNSFFGGDAIDPLYDLAILTFKGADDTLLKIELAERDAHVGSDIISLGYPAGQANAVTFGEILKYHKVTLQNMKEYMSNVTFDVAKHSARIVGGSSGGPLLDPSLRIVGINFASEMTDEQFELGSAIPLSKINEFLDKYYRLGGIAGVKPRS